MKSVSVFYDPDLNTKVEEIPVPEYGPNEILIKVHVAGSNPKDWKHPMPSRFNSHINQGDDAAGIVEAVGSSVKGFHPGDRVAGFHEMRTKRGTYAEYTVCPANTVFHIPDKVSFEEAATIPLAAYTAAVGLYRNLGIPMAFARADAQSGRETVPLIVNGAGSAVGSFAVKLAKMGGGIGPIIGTAGRSKEYAIQSGCDEIVDYRSETIIEDLKAALKGAKAAYVFDAENTIKSVKYLTAVMEDGGRYTGTVSPTDEQKETLGKKGIWWEWMWVGNVHDDKPAGGALFGSIMSKIFEEGLKAGTFSGQPYKVIPKGLEGVLGGLVELRDRKSGNEKLVYRIADTPGV